MDIINLQFKQFVNKHYQKICERFKVDESTLKKAILEIEKLNPKPASNSNQTKYTQQIIPDFTIHMDNEQIEFTLNSRNAPSLNISKDYMNMLNLYKETGGKIDVFISNAATFERKLNSLDSFKSITKTIDINLIAPILITNMLSKFMIQNKKGLIIYFSSVATIINEVGTSIYSSSKSGLEKFSQIIKKGEKIEKVIRLDYMMPFKIIHAGLTDPNYPSQSAKICLNILAKNFLKRKKDFMT